MTIMNRAVTFVLLLLTMETAAYSRNCDDLPSKLPSVRFWNPEAQKCLEAGRSIDIGDYGDTFIKKGGGAFLNLEECTFSSDQDQDMSKARPCQKFHLTQVDILDPPVPKGHSARRYRMSTNFHECFIVMQESHPRLMTGDALQYCNQKPNSVQFVLTSEESREGVRIVVTSGANTWCLTALPVRTTSGHEVRLQECRASNRMQFWYVCSGDLAKNCTETLQQYF